jgi:hypothetical protein
MRAPHPRMLRRLRRRGHVGKQDLHTESAEGQRVAVRDQDLDLRAQQAEIDARSAARRHFLRMQTWILLGVGSLIVLTIFVLVLGLWVDAISSSFATELARTTLPILLGAAATIVGAFFGVGSGLNPGSGFESSRQRRRRRDQE